MRTPLNFAKPPAPAGLREIAEQQARLRTGVVPGLKEALAAPPVADTIPATDAAGKPYTAAFLTELGLTLAALGNAKLAMVALRRATAMEAGLEAAWRKLAELCRLSGDRDGEAECAAALTRCAKTAAPESEGAARGKPTSPAKWHAAERALAKRIMDGKPEQAGLMLRQHLRANPTDVAALRLLGEIGGRNGRYADAERILERARELAPAYLPVRRDLGAILLTQNRHVQALPHLQWVLAQEPKPAIHRMQMAFCLGSIGDYERAIPLYEDAAEDVFRIPAYLLNYANCLRTVGRRADSVRAYRACLEVAPGSGEAWWGLANIKNEAFSAEDVAAMQAQLATVSMPKKDRIHIHYALGSALEQARDYATSFTQYSRGAALQRAEFNYDPDETTRTMRAMEAFYTPARFAAFAGAGCPDPSPIFVLGMPRAGSTLIEQILSSHSAVEGTRELPEINTIVRELGAFGDPAESLGGLDAAQLAELGARYVERCRVYRKTDRPFFIDKMPSNWVQTGLIHQILPNARIIDARRHPMAGCFANFKQLFGSGAHYTYSLSDLGHFYADYVKWMAHIDAALPGRVHRVMYERMVDDMEGETRRLLAYCGLAFEPGCLRFWESRRAVATPSSEQVRQPIFRDGLEQWRNYEPWLKPLQAVLENRLGAGAAA